MNNSMIHFPKIFFKKSPETTRAFSLVELMVAMSIFAIVMVMSTGTLLVMINSNAKAQALYESTTNLSFALDSMTRELRMGYGYYCSTSVQNSVISSLQDCLGGNGIYISFTRERDNVRMGYRLNGESLEQNTGSGWSPITSPEVKIQTFSLTVSGTDTSDGIQPTINFSISADTDVGHGSATSFSVQSHIVQRRLDI